MSKKRIALLMAVVMVLGVAVGSTMAWLTSGTAPVTNTFTVGNIDIELKEHDYIKESNNVGATEVDSNAYDFVPGDTLTKDPFVRVKPNSEDCYLFVYVNALHNSSTATVKGETKTVNSILTWEVDTSANEWTAVQGYDGVYYRSVSKATTEQIFNVLKNKQVKVSSEVIKEMVNDINTTNEKPQIVVNAFAHQSKNTDLPTAQAAALAHFGFANVGGGSADPDPSNP